MNFLVIDTEGKEYLREIAIINDQGKLVYEAFAKEHIESDTIHLNVKPLEEIIQDFSQIINNQLLIFHLATHDLQVLKNSYQSVGIVWYPLRYDCTFRLAQQYYPYLQNYSLEYLSRKRNLKVNHQHFNPSQAHSARYDAAFTYQLYLDIQKTKENMNTTTIANPFSSNRVDNPFQDHVDFKTLYQTEFNYLKSIIADIKADPNHQSQGVIIIGEAGSGKTHLIMRLAKELLKVNRLLFIRHPNNLNTILYHIYSRILDSFIKEVPETGYTQLEHLLSHSFVKLISQSTFIRLTQKDSDIQTIAKNEPLELYEKLGKEDTQRKRDYWQHIEKRASEWWMDEYGIGGYAPKILKGIIKFCSYTRRKEKSLVSRWLSAEELTEEDISSIGLNNWDQEMSKEEFSLEAISVFSKLSLLDEPLIIVFDQLESLGLPHNEALLLSFGEAVKEIFTHVPHSLIILNLFPERWQQFQTLFNPAVIDRASQHKIALNRPSNEQLLSILNLKTQPFNLNLASLFTSQELTEILQGTSIREVINNANRYFYQKRLPTVDSAVIISSKITTESRLSTLEKEVTQLRNLLQTIGQSITDLLITIPSATTPIEHNHSIESSITPHPVSNLIKHYLQENRQLLEQDYQQLQIITDSDDLGKLITIAESFKMLYPYPFEIDHLRLGRKKLPDHLLIQKSPQSLVIGFLHADGSTFSSRIKNFNELVIIYKNHQFQLWRDERKSDITGKVGQENMMMLNNAPNGQFQLMEKEQRIEFELIYKMIIDIQNQDLNLPMEEALKALILAVPNSWIIQIFQ